VYESSIVNVINVAEAQKQVESPVQTALGVAGRQATDRLQFWNPKPNFFSNLAQFILFFFSQSFQDLCVSIFFRLACAL